MSPTAPRRRRRSWRDTSWRSIKGRDRTEAERFVALRSHYGFESFFCQPGLKGAHEKGGVEGEIGRFRRRHLVPVPKTATLAPAPDRACVVPEPLATSAALNRDSPHGVPPSA